MRGGRDSEEQRECTFCPQTNQKKGKTSHTQHTSRREERERWASERDLKIARMALDDKKTPAGKTTSKIKARKIREGEAVEDRLRKKAIEREGKVNKMKEMECQGLFVPLTNETGKKRRFSHRKKKARRKIDPMAVIDELLMDTYQSSSFRKDYSINLDSKSRSPRIQKYSALSKSFTGMQSSQGESFDERIDMTTIMIKDEFSSSPFSPAPKSARLPRSEIKKEEGVVSQSKTIIENLESIMKKFDLNEKKEKKKKIFQEKEMRKISQKYLEKSQNSDRKDEKSQNLERKDEESQINKSSSRIRPSKYNSRNGSFFTPELNMKNEKRRSSSNRNTKNEEIKKVTFP